MNAGMKKIEVEYYGDEVVAAINRIDKAFTKLRLSGHSANIT